MKRLIILMFIPILFLSLNAQTEQKVAPMMKFESTSIDFGEAESGKIVDVEYKFTNIGKTTLIINAVNTSCGCTAPRIDKKEYAPGEKGTIPVKFDTRGYNGPTTKTITLSLNDPNYSSLVLEMKGTVKMTQFAEIGVEPNAEKIDFKNVKIGKTYTEKIRIRNSGTINLRFIEVCGAPEAYVIFPKKELTPGESMEIKIIFTPMQNGPFVQFLKLSSNAYKQRMFIVKISALVGDSPAPVKAQGNK